MKYIMIASMAVAMQLGGSAAAAVYTYTWDAATYALTPNDGHVTVTMHGTHADKITRITCTGAADDRFVFTGDKMSFVNTSDANTSTVALDQPCTVVFQNDVDARSMSATTKNGASVVRFEGVNTKFTGSPSPSNRVRMEIADVSKFSGGEWDTYPVPESGGTFALLDGSQTIKWRSQRGDGTISFETTKPTDSSDVTNVITLASANYWTPKFTVKGYADQSGVYPMVLNVTTTNSFPQNKSITVQENGILRLSKEGVGGNHLTGMDPANCEFIAEKGGLIEQCKAYVFGPKQKITLDGGKLVVGIGNPVSSDAGVDILNLTMRNGAELVNGGTKDLRIGRVAPGLIWTIDGAAPSTNSVQTQFQSPGNYVFVTNTFNVAKTGDYEADFVQKAKLCAYTGGEPFRTACFRKIGAGTMLFLNNYRVVYDMILEEGLVVLGVKNCFSQENDGAAIRVCFNGGGLKTADGLEQDANQSIGRTKVKVCVNADSYLMVGAGATVSFADSSTETWVSGKRLSVTIPTKADGTLNGSLRFGTNANGLTAAQVQSVRLNGKRATLDENGYLCRLNAGLVVTVR